MTPASTLTVREAPILRQRSTAHMPVGARAGSVHRQPGGAWLAIYEANGLKAFALLVWNPLTYMRERQCP
jgi:hypothetical protein